MSIKPALAPSHFDFDPRFGEPDDTVNEASHPEEDWPAKLEAARQAGYAQGKQEGHSQGLADAIQSQEAQIITLLDQILHQSKALLENQAVMRDDLERQATRLAVDVGRTLADIATARFPLAQIEGAILAALQETRNNSALTIAVAADQCSAVQTLIEGLEDDSGSANNLSVESEAGLPPGGARITWGDSGLVLNPQHTLDYITQALNEIAPLGPEDAQPQTGEPDR